MRSTFQLYPFAAFSEIFSNLLPQPELLLPENSHLEILQNTINILQDVAAADDSSTYCHKLCTATSRCIAMATKLIQRTEAISKSQTVSTKFSPPQSRTRSRTNTNGNHSSAMPSPISMDATPSQLRPPHPTPTSASASAPENTFHFPTVDGAILPGHFERLLSSGELNEDEVMFSDLNFDFFGDAGLSSSSFQASGSGTANERSRDHHGEAFSSLDEKDGWLGLGLGFPSQGRFQSRG